MLRSISGFEDMQYDLTDAIGKGVSALEMQWRAGDVWLPEKFYFVPATMLQIDRESGAFQYLNYGVPEPLIPFKWLVHEHRALSGYIEGAALFRVLAWTYAYKAYNTLDMQKFLEKYGLPLRLGKYPSGLATKDRDELLRAVRNIGNDGAGVVPNTMSIEFVQATKTGTVNDFLSAIEYWERKQSMAILGGTLTSQADGKTSTNALGAIHNQVRREIMLHDVRQITPTIQSQLIEPIVRFNGLFEQGRTPQFQYNTAETVDQAAMVEVLQAALAMGMRIDQEYAHRVLQIPMAEEGAQILTAQGSMSAAPAGDKAGGKAEKKKDKSEKDKNAAALRSMLNALGAAPQAASGEGEAALAAFVQQLGTKASKIEETWVDKMVGIVDEAGDFDEAIAAIEALSTQTQNKPMAEQLALALATAILAGRSDAQDESN